MKIEVNIDKKYFFGILFCLVVLGGGILVYALVPGQAPPNGHTINEIAPPANCDNGGVLSWDSNNNVWKCISQSASGGINLITPSDEITLGGSWKTIDVSQYVPQGTKVVLLEGNVSTNKYSYCMIKVRSSHLGPEYFILKTFLAVSHGGIDDIGQGFSPVNSSLSFQAIESGCDYGASIRIIGYVI